ncbi:MATE family efflux transporter [Kordiimonas pumila]|uniref:Multidrug-efflux transporter n=1 Tax=Kordiimonas pumila TaxID=2161677 RepID=A0ABV7D0J1_9PROT|nr:MATE family efflux transporter [Kordiimonas pumila]
MTAQQIYHDRAWLKERLQRHFSELFRLATPTVLMRIGILGLGMVDTAMVGHYATQHLAWLNLANQSVIMFSLVVGIGLVSGIIVYTSNAYGTDDFIGAGKVWRRSVPFSALIGLILIGVAWPAEYWLTLLGQTPENAATSGHLVQILALGMPGHMLFITCTMFMEGVKRAEVGFYLMLFANIINVALNYMLIFGHFGMPEMGAEGSAWASTAVRWVMAITALIYVWNAPSLRKFAVRSPHGQAWNEWSDQRQIGYASGVSLAAEVIAFAALAVFAGWLGTVPLAAHGVASQMLGLPLMISIGIGFATTVRVGIAFSRRDKADILLAGCVGIFLNLVFAGILGLVIYFQNAEILAIFTKDSRIIEILLPIALIYAVGMVFDASQMVASLVLRGLKETWWPTYLQSFSFILVMLPFSYLLAFKADMGLKGLIMGMLIGVIVAFALQIARFWILMRRSF